MEAAIEIANKYYKERLEAIENIEKDLKILIKKVKEILDDAEIYLFESYVKGTFNKFLSDVDILIVSDKIPEKAIERAKIRLKIKESIGRRYFIFQLHLMKREDFQIFKNFIDKLVRIA